MPSLPLPLDTGFRRYDSLIGCAWPSPSSRRKPGSRAGNAVPRPKGGEIMAMPGLPARPAAEVIDVDDDGNISGLF